MSVRRMAGRDPITVTNTFTDSEGGGCITLHTTVVGVTAEDVDPAIDGCAERDDARRGHLRNRRRRLPQTVRPGRIRIADEGLTRTPGTASFEDVKVGDALNAPRPADSRRPANYAGVPATPTRFIGTRTSPSWPACPTIAHGMLTMGLGAGLPPHGPATPGVARYAVRLSAPAIVSARGAAISSSAAKSSLTRRLALVW
jgi:hypothetical protein